MTQDKVGRTVTLTNGRVVQIKPVPPLLSDAMREKIPLPEPPVEMITVPYGEEEWENINDPKYQADLVIAKRERQQSQWDTLFLLGVDEEPPEDDSWTKPLEYLGYETPTDPYALKLFWIKNHLIESQIDFFTLTEAISSLSVATREEVDAIAASFRGILQRSASTEE